MLFIGDQRLSSASDRHKQGIGTVIHALRSSAKATYIVVCVSSVFWFKFYKNTCVSSLSVAVSLPYDKFPHSSLLTASYVLSNLNRKFFYCADLRNQITFGSGRGALATYSKVNSGGNCQMKRKENL